MAHELTERADGTVEMAFTGPRSAIWHGLGQNIEEGQSIEAWRKAAGLDWEVLESPVTYSAVNGSEVEHLTFPDRKILFRSDNKQPLGFVGENFKIVQPEEVLEFFRDLVDLHGFRLSTAGSMFDGRRFWALAETGMEGRAVDGDDIEGHLLLTTAVDGTMSTQARFTSTRVVCNNTLSIALAGQSGRPIVRVTHKRDFDPTQVKMDLGILDKAWGDFMSNLKKLSSIKMSPKQTREFYEEQLFDPRKLPHEQGYGVIREVNRLVDLAIGGSGSDMSAGTMYGALCGATEYWTHGTGKRDPSHQFWDAYAGDADGKKRNIYNALMQKALA